MEGISLFGATSCLSVISAGGFIIPASCITSDTPSVAGFPVVGEVFMPKEVCAQGFVGSESATDLGIAPKISSNVDSVVDYGMPAEGTSASAATTPADSEHLDNIGEFEFPTSFFGNCMQYSSDLVIPHQMLYGLDYIV
jgi:hypothetical protein